MTGKSDASQMPKAPRKTTKLAQDKIIVTEGFLVNIHNNQIPNSKNELESLCILPKNKPKP